MPVDFFLLTADSIYVVLHNLWLVWKSMCFKRILVSNAAFCLNFYRFSVIQVVLHYHLNLNTLWASYPLNIGSVQIYRHNINCTTFSESGITMQVTFSLWSTFQWDYLHACFALSKAWQLDWFSLDALIGA